MRLRISQPSERDPLWRREMRERWRRPITLFFLTVYVTGFCWFGYSLYASLVVPSLQSGGQLVGLAGIGHRLFVALMGLQMCAWIPITLLLAAPTVAAERQRRSFIEYVLAGLRPRQIIRAKFASIATFIVVLCAIPLPILALCLPLGGVEPLEIVVGVLFEIMIAIASATVGLTISTHNNDVSQAMKHGIVAALVLLGCGALFLPPILEGEPLLWLLLAGGLMVGAYSLLALCEDSLQQFARHLEREERPNRMEAPSYSSFPPPSHPPVVHRQETRASSSHTAVTASRRASHHRPDSTSKPTSWEGWIKQIASCNAVTHREVRVGLRTRRFQFEIAPGVPAPPLPIMAWLVLGVLGMALVVVTGWPALWCWPLMMVTACALLSAATGASTTFTREREQKMITQLQLCPLSPGEIVWGKVAATLLLVARSWGGPLIALFIMSLPLGTLVGGGCALFVLLLLLWATLLATNFSLLCRHTGVATGGTVSVLLTALVLIPIAPSTLCLFVPSLRTLAQSSLLSTLWLEPMTTVLVAAKHAVFAPIPLGLSFLRLDAVLLVLNLLALAAATWFWAQARFDDEGGGTRFWERDLTRTWR